MTDDDLRQLLTRLDAAYAETTGDQWQYVLGHHDDEDIHFVGFRRNPENQWWDRDSTIMTAGDATWVAAVHNAYPALAAALRRLLEERDQTRAEVERLRAALRPFAQGHLYADEELRHLIESTGDRVPLNHYDPQRSPTSGDCRRAKEALGE